MFCFFTLPLALNGAKGWIQSHLGGAIKQTQQHDAVRFNRIPEFHNYGELPQQKTVLSFITAVKAHQLFVFHTLSDGRLDKVVLTPTPTHLVWVTLCDTSVLFDTKLVNVHHVKTSLSRAISYGMKHFLHLYKTSGTEQKWQ